MADRPVPRARGHLAIVALMALALVVGSLLGCGTGSSSHAADDLLRLMVRNRDALEAPGLTARQAAAHLGSAEAAIRFVRDGVYYLSYPGSFTGADGVLRTRIANSNDRAVLLAALLKALGYETQLARADWPANAVPSIGVVPARPPSEYLDLAKAIGYDVNTSAGQQEAAYRAQAASVRVEVDRSMAVLNKLLGDALTAGAPSPETAVESNWVWVMARRPGQPDWQTFDPTFPDEARPGDFTAPFTPSTPHVEVTVEAVHADGSTSQIVTWSGDAAGRDIVLSFIPADRDPAKALQLANPGGVALWMPVLKAGADSVAGTAFGLDGYVLRGPQSKPPVVLQPNGQPRIEAVPLRSLSIADLDVSNYNRVQLTLQTESDQRPYWHAGHFQVVDGGTAVPVRIESQQAEQRPVIIVIDTSGSMDGPANPDDPGGLSRLAVAKQAAIALVDRLAPEQKAALVDFNFGVYVDRPLAAVGPNRDALREAINNLSAGGGTALIDATSQALDMSSTPSYVVLLTDGEDSGDDLDTRSDALLAKIRGSSSTVLPFGIGEADDALLQRMAGASGTQYTHVADATALPLIYQRLGDVLGGRVTISWQAPPAQVGEHRNVVVRLQGYNGTVQGSYVVPAVATRPQALSRIDLVVSVGGGGTRIRRTIVDLTPRSNAWNMLRLYDLFVAAGPYPMRTAQARQLDALIGALQLQRAIASGAQPDVASFDRGMSAAHVQMIDGMTALTAATAQWPTRWNQPMIALLATSFGRSGSNLVRHERIDWLTLPRVPDGSRSLADDARWGLALTAAEARLINGRSVNQELLAQSDRLVVARTEAELPRGASSVLRDTLAAGQWVVTPAGSPGPAWVVDPQQGTVLGYLPDEGVTAKGAVSDAIDSALSDPHTLGGLLCSLGAIPFAPIGVLCGGLVGYFTVLARHYCLAASQLGGVSRAIETGHFDAAVGQELARKQCGGSGSTATIGGDLLKGLAGGALDSYLNGVIDHSVGVVWSEYEWPHWLSTAASFAATQANPAAPHLPDQAGNPGYTAPFFQKLAEAVQGLSR